MPKLVFRCMLLSLLLALTACLAPQSPDSQSRYPLAMWFPDNPQAQALALAAEKGRTRDVQRLMKDEGVDPDVVFTSNDGTPLLVIPILANNPAGLKAMLDNGADPNVKQAYDTGDRGMRYHGNAMVWAAKQEDPIYLKLLLDHGGDPDTRNANNETLLFQARIWSNQWQNVQLLVERGADINARTRGGGIVDTYAKMGGFMQAYWLLEHGAKPMANDPVPSEPKRSYLVEAIFWHPGNPKDPTWQRKCQQWLLAHGYARPPMPDYLREMRKNLGFPHEEDQIPLL